MHCLCKFVAVVAGMTGFRDFYPAKCGFVKHKRACIVVLYVLECGVGTSIMLEKVPTRVLQGHMHAWQLVYSLQTPEIYV